MPAPLPHALEKYAIRLLLAAIAMLMLISPVVRRVWPGAAFQPLRLAADCLAWLISFGMARGASLGVHDRVVFLARRLGEGARRRLSLFADLAFLLFALTVLAAGVIAFARAWQGDGALAGCPLWVLAAAPTGAVLTIVRLAERLRAGVQAKAEVGDDG